LLAQTEEGTEVRDSHRRREFRNGADQLRIRPEAALVEDVATKFCHGLGVDHLVHVDGDLMLVRSGQKGVHGVTSAFIFV
jgi:hypothetical protein